MKLKQLLFGFLFFSALNANAQKETKEVLFTIDEKPYYTDEFSRVYKKNLDLVKDDSQKDLDQYLELYIGYKLKVNRAYKLGLQDNSAYKTELNSYRTQLAKNYFNDTKITQELVEEGYNRLQKEVKAAHILILVDENATAEDTLKAYKKIQDIKNRVEKGESFEDLAFQLSEDPSAKENKGDLGYFTAFRMVYPFENAAFTTPKGQVSNIVRTRFGYHILKVNDVRSNRGEVTVAHIMTLNPKPEDADQEKAKNTINDIYKKINQGEKFEDLARQFSEDKSSSSKGGVLNKFGSGQLSSDEFENVAFALKNSGDISQPFQSKFGWHIVKLIERHPVRTLEEMKAEIETKVGRDDRSKKIVTSLNDKLRKKYKVKKEAKQFAAVSKLVTNDFYEDKWLVPANADSFSAPILKIENTSVSGKTFLEFVEKQQKSKIVAKPISKAVDVIYERFVDEQLKKYYDDNLENEFPEFSYVMEEYRDGLLLFDLMEKEIWERSKSDSIGLQKFYDDTKANHVWKKRVEATIYSSTKQDIIKKVQSLIKKKATAQEVKEKLNTKEVVNVMANSGVFEEGSQVLPKGIKLENGISGIVKEGEYYFIAVIDNVLPEGIKTLDECRGKLTNEYQQYLEQNWVENLKKEFNIKVNKDVFEKVKKELK
jgi:peptidyl-prolyl cis-trans isomerase SurA